MWTPKIEAIDNTNGQIIVHFNFSSSIKNEESFNRSYVFNDINSLKQTIQSEINRIERILKDSEVLVVGEIFDTIIPPPEQTPDEQARQKYFKDLVILNLMIEGIKNGVRKDTDQDYLDQLALVKSEFKPEYESIP